MIISHVSKSVARFARTSASSPVVAALAIFGFIAASSAARAETISFTAVTYVLFGTVGSQNIVTDETGYGGTDSRFTVDSATSIGSILATDLASDPQASGQVFVLSPGGVPEGYALEESPIPQFVLTAVANSANGNILGLDSGIGTVISPDPATAAFNTILGATGSFVPFDTLAEFTYEVDSSFTTGPYAGDDVDLLENFQFEQLSATPLPSTWTMMLIGLAGLGFFTRRGTKNRLAISAP